jgi:hypothetical protein
LKTTLSLNLSTKKAFANNALKIFVHSNVEKSVWSDFLIEKKPPVALNYSTLQNSSIICFKFHIPETAHVDYRLSFANQEKLTSVVRLQQTNGSCLFPSVPFSI